MTDLNRRTVAPTGELKTDAERADREDGVDTDSIDKIAKMIADRLDALAVQLESDLCTMGDRLQAAGWLQTFAYELRYKNEHDSAAASAEATPAAVGVTEYLNPNNGSTACANCGKSFSGHKLLCPAVLPAAAERGEDKRFPPKAAEDMRNLGNVLIGAGGLLDQIKFEWGGDWSEFDQRIRDGITWHLTQLDLEGKSAHLAPAPPTSSHVERKK